MSLIFGDVVHAHIRVVGDDLVAGPGGKLKMLTTGVFETSSLDGLDFVYDGGKAFPLIVIGIYLAIFLGVPRLSPTIRT